MKTSDDRLPPDEAPLAGVSPCGRSPRCKACRHVAAPPPAGPVHTSCRWLVSSLRERSGPDAAGQLRWQAPRSPLPSRRAAPPPAAPRRCSVLTAGLLTAGLLTAGLLTAGLHDETHVRPDRLSHRVYMHSNNRLSRTEL
ncbi:hypothetical protein EYF80_044808 [Liparis tanakae]|uniref:Uncharacterized protein n=1 Tax=Liparis tanakae TaxID=230148 RepID=A0A4Z2FW23_9TELE|nr:hypothetical protein EYF80_044808 [Liparis tanakae]